MKEASKDLSTAKDTRADPKATDAQISVNSPVRRT